VLINSGGSAGSGSGCSPDAPKEPQEADKSDPGQVSAADPRTPPPAEEPANLTTVKAANYTSPQARALVAAAESGAPFCEKCEAARRAREAQTS
jgi:type VI secretion system secreted protein VgrG